MTKQLSNRRIVYRYKLTYSTSGNYFNVPPKIIKNKYIDKDKEYEIYIVENSPEHDILAKSKSDLQQFLKSLDNYYPFRTSIASAGSSYRITISSFLIENKYFDPEKAKGREFWIYFVEDI